MLNSAIYEGELHHRRMRLGSHAFRYKVFMMYLDLDELERVFSLSRFWSMEKPALARMKQEDYFYDAALGSIKETVRQFIFEETGERLSGRICLLANVRYFGYIINPIACYYCFDEDERLRYVIAEVTSTPWKERHRYLLPVADNEKGVDCYFDKRMHVSPFMENDMQYYFRGNVPVSEKEASLHVRLQNYFHGQLAFQASLNLKRQEISTATLNRILIRFPLMTVKVVLAIHWQALKLFLKGVPFIKHVKKQELLDEV